MEYQVNIKIGQGEDEWIKAVYSFYLGFPEDRRRVIMMEINDDTVLTPNILLENGFIEYHTGDENSNDSYDITYPSELPIYPDAENGARVFFEKDYHRNLFVISFQLDESIIQDVTVYVMHDVGCGYSEMPFRWVEITVGVINHLYMAFMNKKLINC